MVGHSSDRGFLVRSDLVREHALSDGLEQGQPADLIAPAKAVGFSHKQATV
ncbi:hypothetical protein D3C86_2206600 [compost metagenome]